MKFRQEFSVAQPVDRLWAFFEKPEQVAACIPGVEEVAPIAGNSFDLRASQRLGPLSATFEAKVRITEKVPGERIAFTATGRAVRGAVGSFRASNLVLLQPRGAETAVLVEGEAALAGVLGSVAGKVIDKQAAKVTAEFARNLEQALAGGGAGLAEAALAPAGPVPAVASPTAAAAMAATARPGQPTVVASDNWTKAAAILSGAATLVGLLVLWQVAG